MAGRRSLSGFNANSQRVTAVANASTGTDAPNWQQVQDFIAAAIEGKTYKDAVRAATTAVLPANTYNSGAGTLTGNANAAFAATDGVTLALNEDILVKNQASAFQNGIYKLTTVGSGAAPYVLTRRIDASTAAELRDGATVMVAEGTANADKSFTQTSVIANLTADAQVWANTSGTTYTAGNGLALSANAFSVLLDTASGMSVSGTGVKNDWAVTARKMSQDSAAASTMTLTHNWGTKDIGACAVRDTATDEEVDADWVPATTNTVVITFPAAVGAGAYRATIIG